MLSTPPGGLAVRCRTASVPAARIASAASHWSSGFTRAVRCGPQVVSISLAMFQSRVCCTGGWSLAKATAAVAQNPQYGKLFVVDEWPQPRHPGADQRDAVRVGGVGLAALSGGEHPRSGGQLWWDVDDLLAVGE
jgi:hypothetical protein